MVFQAPVIKEIACFKKGYSEDNSTVKVGVLEEVITCRLREKGAESVLQLYCATECMTKYQLHRYMYYEVRANRYQVFMEYTTLRQVVTRCEIRTGTGRWVCSIIHLQCVSALLLFNIYIR